MSTPIADLQLLPTPRMPEDIFRWGQENFRKLQDAYVSLLSYVAALGTPAEVPTGAIFVWNSATAIPSGYQRADGTNGTVNLTAEEHTGTYFIQKV